LFIHPVYTINNQKASKKYTKMKKKTLKINTLLIFLFLFCSSCVKNIKDCKISPDLEQIGESVLKNKENLSKTELRSAQMRCKY
jgi:hypothetical protein